MLLAYLWLNMRGSDLERSALLLLSQLEHLEATEAETVGEEDLGAEPPEPGVGQGAMRWLRSLSPWTTIWEVFHRVGSWAETSLTCMRVFLSLRGTCKGSRVGDISFSWSYSRAFRTRSRTTSRTSTSCNSSACYRSEPQIEIQSPRRLKTQLFKT
ncbi:hypothetical protein HPG69_017682 [Diceros bicornis minor]|uniref:Uncharacterized protein n=1 Tax=Diceros bicornis minor TaxID=77932 RepID=A0A7J7FGW5_DICBM|nr:hypothetical protein HPG69_017682 [Diceros bicornis minor]